MKLSHLTITEIENYNEMNIDGENPEVLINLYRQMIRLRRIEEALLNEYHPANEMRCPIHFCIGQESIPAALSLLVKDNDYLFSHHRSHGYYFAKNSPIKELFAELYGKATGASGGKAGSQDISHTETNFFSGAILAGAVSIAVGAAFAFKHIKSTQISISGFGEGCTDEGAFWEAMNYAGKQKLPILFLCENNRYATFSDQLKRQSEDNISERVNAFGVRSIQIFGNDVVLAYQTIKNEINKLRAGDGPVLIEAYTYRWNSHVGPEDDSANNYRSQKEVDFWKKNCPILLLHKRLTDNEILTNEIITEIEMNVMSEVKEYFTFAKNSPFPNDIDWQLMNYSNESPLADKLLKEVKTETLFNHSQNEAKLGPY